MGAALQFVAAGDVAVERDEGAGLFGDLTGLFRDADVSFVNLEGALSTRGTLTRGRAFFHRGGPGCGVGLREAGLSGVCLANNHLMDWGEPSFEETIEVLDRNEVPWFGAGANLAEARRPLIVERDGLTIALVGATTQIPSGYAATDERCGVNPVEVHTVYSQQRSLAESPGLPPRIVTWTDPAALARIEADVSAAADQADVVLVYVHWGTSMQFQVHDFQREIGRVVIDAGAHAVFGGHQHVVCGVEHHRGRPIIHGMGNLVFDKWEPHFTDAAARSVIVRANLDADGLHDVTLLPARCAVLDSPSLLSPSDEAWDRVVDDLQTGSVGLGTELVVEDDGIRVRPA